MANDYEAFKQNLSGRQPNDYDKFKSQHASVTSQPPQAPQTTLADRAKDVAITGLKSAIGVPEAALGLADIVTAGKAGKLAEQVGFRPKEAKSFLDEQYSPAQQTANTAVRQADGFIPSLKAYAQNPSVIAHDAGEQILPMLGGGVISQGVRKLAPKVAPYIAGAIGEGALTAGQNVEQVRQETPGGELDFTKQVLPVAASGVLTGAIAAGSGKIAEKLGITDVQSVLAGGDVSRTGGLKNIAGTIALEGAGQELPQSIQEQAAQNYAMDRPLTEGLGSAAAQGLVLGSAIGAGGAIAQGPLSRAATTAQQTGAANAQTADVSDLPADGAANQGATGASGQAMGGSGTGLGTANPDLAEERAGTLTQPVSEGGNDVNAVFDQQTKKEEQPIEAGNRSNEFDDTSNTLPDEQVNLAGQLTEPEAKRQTARQRIEAALGDPALTDKARQTLQNDLKLLGAASDKALDKAIANIGERAEKNGVVLPEILPEGETNEQRRAIDTTALNQPGQEPVNRPLPDSAIQQGGIDAQAQADTGIDESVYDNRIQDEAGGNYQAKQDSERLQTQRPPLADDLTQKSDAELEVLRQNTFNVRNSESLKRRAEIVAEQKRRKTLPPQEETQDVHKQERPGNFGTENQSADSANRQRLRAAESVPMERDSSTASGTGEATAGEQPESRNQTSPRITDERQDANAETGKEAEQKGPLLTFTPTHELADGTVVRQEDDGSFTDRDNVSYTPDNESRLLKPAEIEAYREQETQAQNQEAENGAGLPASGIAGRPSADADGRVSGVPGGLPEGDQSAVDGGVSGATGDVSELNDEQKNSLIAERAKLDSKYKGPFGPAANPPKSGSAQHQADLRRIEDITTELGQQIWQRTQDQVRSVLSMTPEGHKRIIQKALSEGKPVPTEVLKDYPDLQNESTQTTSPTNSAQPAAQDQDTPAPGTLASTPGTQAEPVAAVVQAINPRSLATKSTEFHIKQNADNLAQTSLKRLFGDPNKVLKNAEEKYRNNPTQENLGWWIAVHDKVNGTQPRSFSTKQGLDKHIEKTGLSDSFESFRSKSGTWEQAPKRIESPYDSAAGVLGATAGSIKRNGLEPYYVDSYEQAFKENKSIFDNPLANGNYIHRTKIEQLAEKGIAYRKTATPVSKQDALKNKIAQKRKGGVSNATLEQSQAKSAADWAQEMTDLNKVKPRPLEKMYGKNPTEAQVKDHAEKVKEWNRKYRFASKQQKIQLEIDNKNFREQQAKKLEQNSQQASPSKTQAQTQESGAQPEQALKRKLIEQRFTPEELSDLRQKSGEVRDINRYASGRYGADKVKGVDLRDYFAQPLAPTPAKTPEVEANQGDAVAKQPAQKTPESIQVEGDVSKKEGEVDASEKREYAPLSSIDTPIQGNLNGMRAAKEAAFKEVKRLREKLKNEPISGNRSAIRLQLLKAEARHKEYVRGEEEAKAAIEKRANELGKTTIKPKPAKLSQSQPTTGSTVAELTAKLDAADKKLLQSGKLNIVQKVSDVPKHVLDTGDRMTRKNSIVAWHGSPHDHNKFASSKIGTGEGAQAFGYGHYFTDKKEIAEWYKDKLERVKPATYFVNDVEAGNKGNGNWRDVYLQGAIDGMLSEQIESLGRVLKDVGELADIRRDYEYAKSLIGKDVTVTEESPIPGKLYQVELAPNDDELLDWNKPLSQQSDKIKSIIAEHELDDILNPPSQRFQGKRPDYDATGEELYRALSESGGSQQEASDNLHRVGIRGIRYLAEQGKSGASNFVIFDDNDITIKEKYSRNERIEGFYKDGKVWIIADNVTPETLRSTLNHEYLHASLDQNPKLRDRLLGAQSELRDIFAQVEAGKYTGRYKAIYDAAMKRVDRANTPEADRFEEMLAYAVSEWSKSPQSLPERLAKAIQNLVAAIRAAIFKYSGKIDKIGPAELSSLAKSAMAIDNKGAQNYSQAKGVTMTSTKSIPDTITVDGKERPTVNSNGDIISQTEDGIRKFWRWFSNSAVVDKDGSPLVVYHGSKALVNEFKKVYGGIYFAEDSQISERYTNDATPHEYYLNSPNEFDVNSDYAESVLDEIEQSVFGEDADEMLIGPDGRESLYELAKWGNLIFGGREVQDKTFDALMKNGYTGVKIPDFHGGGENEIIHVVFEPSQIKSVSDNAGIFDPQSPDIRYSIADDVRENAQNITSGLIERLSTNKTFNWWHKTVGTQFHKALVDKHFGKVFNRSMQFEQDMARLANEAADLAPSLLPKLDALTDVGNELKEFAQGAVKGQAGRRMIDSRRIGEAVFQTTLQDKPMTDKELTDAGYTESQRKMYREFFAAVNRSLDDLAKSEMFRMARALKIGQAPDNLSLKETANWYAEQAEDANQGKDFIDKAAQVEKLKKEGYAPLMRFGQYTLDVVTPKSDGTEKREFFGMFETEQEAKEMEKAMRSEYPDSNIERGIMSQNDWQMFKGVTPETMEVFAKMMNVEQDEAFQAYLKSAVTNRSAMKRLIHRKKMPGFAKDTQRILASFLTSNARAASKNYHLGELVDAIAAIPKTKGDVIDEAVELYNYVQNPSAKGAAIRGLMFAWYLGGSVSSAAVNLTQSFTTTLPYLHQFGSTKQVARLMGQAMKLAANHKAIAGDLGRALKLADEEGITDPKELHMLYGESMRTGMLSNQFLRPLSKVWGSFFSLAESYNRRVSFIAAYNLAKETNQPDPFQFAANAVNETQFVYNKSSRPNWARSTIGSTVFTFKTFTINYLEFLKRLPAKERVIALGVLVAFAGLSGAPGADDLDDLIDTFGQAMGYNTNSKAWKDRVLSDFIGKEAAQYALYGLSHGMPFDVSSRLSVGNIIPGSALFKKSEIDKSRDVMEFAGPAGSLSKRIVDAFEAAGSRDSLTGQASAVGKALVPKAMADVVQAMDMQLTGQYRDTRGRKVADADLPDVIAKALGFQPTSVAEPRRAERYLNQSVTMAKAVEGDIAGLWASGIVEKNRGKVEEAKTMLQDWNAKNPETPIRVNMKQITRRVKQMRLTSGERLLKSTPKEIRRYAREAIND
jgi:hypothetical protein